MGLNDVLLAALAVGVAEADGVAGVDIALLAKDLRAAGKKRNRRVQH
ncbi:MAG: hypothetical protein GY798_14020 [Hyphomicrobiales bacterium]|nr:hypothetical protein [Hyphomicrobiales bacterium]